MIRKIANKDSVILLQNAFPILEKYIDHPHMLNGKPLKVVNVLKKEILENFKYMLISKNVKLPFAESDIIAISEDENKVLSMANKKLQEYILPFY